MTLLLRTLRIVFDDAGAVRAVQGDYDDVTADGRSSPAGTRRIKAAEVAGVLPDVAAMFEALSAAQAEVERLAGIVEAAKVRGLAV